jgi:cyclopropane fatty-acyl-phospholipid synthase-like methyltransferase
MCIATVEGWGMFLMPRIMIIHPEGNLNNNPNLSGIVEILCAEGYDVHMYSPKLNDVQQHAPCPRSRFFFTPEHKILKNVTAVLPTEVHHDQLAVHAFIESNIQPCNLVIGIDRGIVEASVIARHFGVPYGLISYELLFAEETGEKNIAEFVAASHNVSFAVCQDRVRSLHLSRENGIPLERIVDIPVAGRAARRGAQTSILHDALGLSKDRKIALYMGGVTSVWSGINELLAEVHLWPDDWALVLHHRYAQYNKKLEVFIASQQKKNIFLSPFAALPFSQIHELLFAADLGLSFYIPQEHDINAGNNLKYIGMASGKTATYLQHGVPILINDGGEMGGHTRKENLGRVVGQLHEIPSVLASISRQDLSAWKNNCISFFEKELDLDARIAPLMTKIRVCIGTASGQPAHPAMNQNSNDQWKAGDGKHHRQSQEGKSTTPTQGVIGNRHPQAADERTAKRVCAAEKFQDFAYAKKHHFTLFGKSDRELFHAKVDPMYADLKAYQDLLVFTFIKNNIPPGSRILDIGGGDSRILQFYKNSHECWNLDKLEGNGNGPVQVDSTGYRLVKDFIGNFNNQLPENYFDFIFSISALEHVPNGRVKNGQLYHNMCLDIDRILKSGGKSLHLFDILISERRPCWTNDFAPFMSEYFTGIPSRVPFERLVNDAELYVVSEQYFNAFWKGAPNVNEYADGKPSSWNVLWEKPDTRDDRVTKKQWSYYKKFLTPQDESQPRISVVTPSFNQAEFLEECIESVLDQQYSNLEYVIMDGGSTDGSADIIRRYSPFLANWQSKPDGGQYAAINEGFALGSGEVMTWLNSDDKFHPGAFKTVADIFSSRHEVDWVMGRPNGFAPDGTQEWVYDYLPLWHREKYLLNQYSNPFIQQEGTFWRRTLWKQAGGFLSREFHYAGDLELWTRFFRHAQLHTTDALLAGFRRQPNQKTQEFLERYHQEAKCVLDRERLLFEQSQNKTLLPAPPIIATKSGNTMMSTDALVTGELEIQNGNFAAAKIIFTRLLEKDPHNIDALNNLAIIHISENNYSVGIELLQQVIVLDPANEIALDNLICLQQVLKDQVTGTNTGKNGNAAVNCADGVSVVNTAFLSKEKEFWNVGTLHEAMFGRVFTSDEINSMPFEEQMKSWYASAIGSAEEITKSLPLDPQWKILEIGCGVGRVIKPLREKFAEVDGVDISEKMIEFAHEYLADGRNNGTVLLNDGFVRCPSSRVISTK